MKHKTIIVIAVAVCLCCFTGLWAQVNTSDNRHFTLPPSAAVVPATPASDAPVPVSGPPAILNFDQLPGPEWTVWDCYGRGTATVSHGILTINSPSDCYEFDLRDPVGVWNKYVSNSRGWIVETNLKIDPLTDPNCSSGGAEIWANDRTNLIIFHFAPNEICIGYPEQVHFAMNTTDSFHVYRIETKGSHTRIYVDGTLAIDHVFTYLGSGSQVLYFGDGSAFGTSVAQWDYFSYSVFPVNLAP